MRRRQLGAVALGWCAATAWMAGCRAQPKLTAQQAEGQMLFHERCLHCHGENDLNLKPAPPEIRGVLLRAKLPDGEPATDLEVMRVVLNGKNKMPPFAGRFTEPQMQALLAFLRTRSD